MHDVGTQGVSHSLLGGGVTVATEFKMVVCSTTHCAQEESKQRWSEHLDGAHGG